MISLSDGLTDGVPNVCMSQPKYLHDGDLISFPLLCSPHPDDERFHREEFED